MLLAGRLFTHILLVLFDFWHFGTLISASSGYCQQHALSKKGDLRIVAVLGLSKSSGRTCGDVSPEAYQAAMALDWATELLNGDGSYNSSYIPGVSIGFDIYDDCGIEELALDAILRSESLPRLSCPRAQTDELPLTAGFIVGPNEESLVAVSKFVRPGDAVFGLSPAIRGKEGWGNILRLRPPIESQTEVTLELLRYYKWNYIGVIYTDDIYGQSSFQNFQELSHNAGVCITLHYKISGPMADDSEVTNSIDNAMTEIRESQFQAEDYNFAVVYFGDMRGAGVLLNILLNSPHNQLYDNDQFIHWIFPQEVGTKPEFQELLAQNPELANFITMVSPTTITFHEFQDYYVDALRAANNTWLNAYALNQHQCFPSSNAGRNIPACTKYDVLKGFRQADSVNAIVDSVFSVLDVLKKQHDQYCGKEAGICELMKMNIADGLYSEVHRIALTYSSFPANLIPKNLASHSLVFDSGGFVNVLGKTVFEVFVQTSHSSFYMMGEFGGSGLIIKKSIETPKPISRCKNNCRECSNTEENRFVYIHGEIIILGLFSIRSKVAGKFECGDYRNAETSISAALAFIESVKSMKQKMNMDFGAIAFDDCYSPLNSISFATDLFSGEKVFVDPRTGTQINPSRIVAVVGALSSQVTLALAELLTPLGVPMVSYGASASWLDDRDRYPYFLRTVPSDTLQVDAMLSILKYFNFTYVGGVNINDAYGKNGILNLQTKAKNSGVCFEDPRSVDENDVQSFDDAISRLKYQLVKVVVFFGLDTTAEILLNRIIKGEYKSGFIFIASEAWGQNSYLLEDGRGEACKDSIILNVQTIEHSDESFRNFLQNLTPTTAKEQSWTKHMWEYIMRCNFLESFSHKYDKICSESGQLSPEYIDRLYSDQRQVHTMHAVYTIGMGVKKISMINGDENLTVYLRDSPKKFVNAIRESVISMANGRIFRPFKEDGNGNIGFVVNSIQKNRGRFQYKEIGSYDEENKLDIYNMVGFNELDQVDVSCMSKTNCHSLAVCRPDTITTTVSPSASTTEGPAVSPYMSAVIVLAVFTGILTFVVILMMLFFFRQEKTKAAILQHRAASYASHLSTGTVNIYDEPRGSICTGIDDTVSIPNGMLNSPSESIQYSRLNPDGTVFISMNSPSLPQTPCTPRSREMFPIYQRNRSHSSTTSLIGANLSRMVSTDGIDNRRDILRDQGNQTITYLSAKDLNIHEEDDDDENVESVVTPYTDMSLGLKRNQAENPTYSLETLPRQSSSGEHKTPNRPDWLPLQSKLLKKSDNLILKEPGNYLNSQTTKQAIELPITLVPDVVMHERSGDTNMTVFI